MVYCSFMIDGATVLNVAHRIALFNFNFIS